MVDTSAFNVTNDQLKLQPKALLKMFAKLGRRAQKELNNRAWEEWNKAEENFIKKWRKK